MAEIAKELKSAEKEIKKEEKKILKSIKKNPWMLVSVILAIAMVAVIVWPSGISKTAAGDKIMAFAKENGVQATLIKVESQGSLYKVTLAIQGQELPVYITKDGKYFTSNAVELKPSTTTATGQAVKDTPKEVPKSDKPKLEAFVFSYCPYGLQFQKALLPAYNLLKDKADIELVAIGAMHGEFEKQESLRQIAIQELYGKDKLWQYLEKFMANITLGEGNCRQDSKCTDPIVNSIMKSLGIDSTKVTNYMKTNAEKIYNEQNARASELGISGSPDVAINGVELQLGRNPEAIKKAICDAFTEGKVPAECSQTLSTVSASAWFGSDAGSASSSAAQC